MSIENLVYSNPQGMLGGLSLLSQYKFDQLLEYTSAKWTCFSLYDKPNRENEPLHKLPVSYQTVVIHVSNYW
jgi:hypothetical protein